jgi:hypothetical protein
MLSIDRLRLAVAHALMVAARRRSQTDAVQICIHALSGLRSPETGEADANTPLPTVKLRSYPNDQVNLIGARHRIRRRIKGTSREWPSTIKSLNALAIRTMSPIEGRSPSSRSRGTTA